MVDEPADAPGFVRLASAGDAAAIAGVQIAAWHEAFDNTWPAEIFESLATADIEMQWARAVISPPGPGFRVLVATAGDVVVGYGALAPADDDDVEPEDMELVAWEVAPPARGHGHGTRLLSAAVDHVRQLGGGSLIVWSLATDDARTSLLRACGFAPDGAHRELALADGWAGAQQAPTLRQVRYWAAV